jgi:hypothetical protein
MRKLGLRPRNFFFGNIFVSNFFGNVCLCRVPGRDSERTPARPSDGGSQYLTPTDNSALRLLPVRTMITAGETTVNSTVTPTQAAADETAFPATNAAPAGASVPSVPTLLLTVWSFTSLHLYIQYWCICFFWKNL